MNSILGRSVPRAFTATTKSHRTVSRAAFIPASCTSTLLIKRSFSGTPNMAHEVKQRHEGKQPERDEAGVEEWKKRAPYRIHDTNEHFEHLYEGSCHCGAVQYELSRKEPLDSKLCHCTTCQTQHAAPFQWAAIFKKEDINFKHGHHDLEWYDPSTKSKEHQLPCKVRCRQCYSPIMDEGRNMILLFPSLIHFKSDQEKANFRPRLHMFYGQRVMDVPDGLPKWTGLNEGEDSQLIEDSPRDLVKELERKRVAEQKKRMEEGKNQAN